MPSSKVAVVIPTYNSGEYIALSMRSLLTQTHQNLTVIVVDNCSTDNTFEIVQGLAKTDTRIITLQNGENTGNPNQSRERGVEEALNLKADWIGFLDSDDIARPRMVETLLKTAEEETADITYSNYTVFTGDGSESDTSRNLLEQFSNTVYRLPQDYWQFAKDTGWTKGTMFWNGLYSAKLFRDVDWTKSELPVTNDLPLTIQLIAKSQKIATTSESLILNRMEPQSISHRIGDLEDKAKTEEHVLEIAANCLATVGLGSEDDIRRHLQMIDAVRLAAPRAFSTLLAQRRFRDVCAAGGLIKPHLKLMLKSREWSVREKLYAVVMCALRLDVSSPLFKQRAVSS